MNAAALPARLSLLLFSFAGRRFGVDAEQIAAMQSCVAQDDDLFWLHQLLDFGGRSLAYRVPTVLSLKGAEPVRVVVDTVEEIAHFDLDEIRPLPLLLEPFVLRKGMWGVLWRNGTFVVLLDLHRLHRFRRERRSEIATSLREA